MHTKRVDQPKQQENKFPKLMVSDSGTIIMALVSNGASITGIKVWPSHHVMYDEFGRLLSNWDASKFRDYSGQVILSNHKIDEE